MRCILVDHKVHEVLFLSFTVFSLTDVLFGYACYFLNLIFSSNLMETYWLPHVRYKTLTVWEHLITPRIFKRFMEFIVWFLYITLSTFFSVFEQHKFTGMPSMLRPFINYM